MSAPALGFGAHTSTVRAAGGSITTDKSTYQFGDTIRVCYTVPGPGPITITAVQGGVSKVVFSGVDSGTGGCATATIGPPTGQECEILTYQGGTAQACFQVLGGSTPPPPPPCCNATPPAPQPRLVPAARFHGVVRSAGGSPVPNANIIAGIGTIQCGSGSSDSSGSYVVDIQSTAGCSAPGSTVVFSVNGQTATQTGTLPSLVGTPVQIDLTVGSPTPPPPAATPPPPPSPCSISAYFAGQCSSPGSGCAQSTNQQGVQRVLCIGTTTCPSNAPVVVETSPPGASPVSVICEAQQAPPPPPVATCNPNITSISTLLPQATQPITIRGSCFGSQSPYNGDSPAILISDGSGNWNAGCQGHGNDQCVQDSITLNVTNWGDSEIDISGFTGQYGSNGWALNGGDAVTVSVWNAQTGNGPGSYTTTVTAPSAPAQPPTVSLNCVPLTLNVGDTTTCTATATANTTGATVQTPVITAADGSIAGSPNVAALVTAPSGGAVATQTFTFSSSGNRTVTATATDSTGQSGSGTSSVAVKPGGLWVYPADPTGDTVEGHIPFAAKAYPTHQGTDPKIDHVNFTAQVNGIWMVACTVTTPDANGVYSCDWWPGVGPEPLGQVTVSFDVYDTSNNVNEAPNGEHVVTFDSSAPSLLLPFAVEERWYICQGYNGQPGGIPDHVAALQQATALDLSIDPNAANGDPNDPNSGCLSSTANTSTGQTVTSPASGRVSTKDPMWGESDFVCINFDAGGSAAVGHLNSQPGSGARLNAGDQIGKVNPPGATVNRGGYAHIHIQVFQVPDCVGQAPVPFDTADRAAFQCVGDLTYAANQTNEWYG